jgi:hypothetical protein
MANLSLFVRSARAFDWRSSYFWNSRYSIIVRVAHCTRRFWSRWYRTFHERITWARWSRLAWLRMTTSSPCVSSVFDSSLTK